MPAQKNNQNSYTKRIIVLAGGRKQYRDILEACREPSSLGQIHFSLTKKLGKSSLTKVIGYFIKAGLLARASEFEHPYQPSLYVLTKMGVRFLEVKPGSKPGFQYVIGNENA